MIKKINALIFPAGSETGFEIYNSLKYNLHVELFGASGTLDHAKYIYDEKHYAWDDFYITNSNFIDKFNEMLNRFKIDVIFPTHDTITLFLAQHREKFSAKIMTSPYQSTLIAREKKLTFDLFKTFDFCPAIYNPPFDDVTYPVFLKPNIGAGGKGTFIVHNKKSLLSKLNESPDLIASEFLPGDELSVDCFSNRKGELLFVGPRTRERITIGISFHSSSVAVTPEIQRIADEINNSLTIRGAWFFQVKKDSNGKFKLMEFAVRQSSTMGLYRQLGVNFALLSIFDAMDIDVKILKNNYSIELDRCLHNRYKIDIEFDTIYIDFDDTIIINDKVNDVAIQFIYQMINRGKKIILITRHQKNLSETLKQYRIHETLFDKIIHIDFELEKINHMDPAKSIFIDNSFEDRNKVFLKYGIPVFDVDAIETFII